MNFEWFSDLLELGNRWPGYLAMSARTVVVFATVLLIVRVGSRRFISKLSAFDMLVAIMIGSIGSRAVTGNSSFGPSLLSIAMIVLLHWLFAVFCYYTDFGRWLKGKPRQLVKDGKLQHHEMRVTNLTRRDIEEALRGHGIIGGAEEVQEAWQERDGSISVVPKDK